MKLEKKSVFLAFGLCFIFLTAYHVQGQAKLGAGLAYGTDIESVGINLNGTFEVSEIISLAPSFTYYIPRSIYGDYKIKWMSLGLNGHYHFDTPGNVKPYALGGLNFSFITFPTYNFSDIWTGGTGEIENETTTKVGINLGGGAEFDIDSPITPFGQIQYSIIDSYGQLVIVGGVRFPIN